jgi:hypothetical protein
LGISLISVKPVSVDSAIFPEGDEEPLMIDSHESTLRSKNVVNITVYGTEGKALRVRWTQQFNHLIAGQPVKSPAGHQVVNHAEAWRPHVVVFHFLPVSPKVRVEWATVPKTVDGVAEEEPDERDAKHDSGEGRRNEAAHASASLFRFVIHDLVLNADVMQFTDRMLLE